MIPFTQVNLRRATLSDLPAIEGIEHHSFVHAGERFGHHTIRCMIRNPRAISLVAELDDRVAGWAAGYLWTRTNRPWGRVYSLAILPDAQGRRLGPTLLRQLILDLRACGANTIFLEVRVDNHVAKRLYEKFGFAVCQDLPDFFAPGLSAVRMQLPAGAAV